MVPRNGKVLGIPRNAARFFGASEAVSCAFSARAVRKKCAAFRHHGPSPARPTNAPVSVRCSDASGLATPGGMTTAVFPTATETVGDPDVPVPLATWRRSTARHDAAATEGRVRAGRAGGNPMRANHYRGRLGSRLVLAHLPRMRPRRPGDRRSVLTLSSRTAPDQRPSSAVDRATSVSTRSATAEP